MRKFVIAFLLICALAIVPVISVNMFDIDPERALGTRADVLWVGGTGAGNYTTIQAAIDDAATDDIIRICNGTYDENIYLNDTLTLIGNSSASTVLNGSRQGSVVTVLGDGCLISTVKIQRSSNSGAGVRVFAENVTISNCMITDNGEGVHMVFANFTQILNCTVEENEIGIFMETSYFNLVENCTVEDNDEQGIHIFQSSKRNTVKDTATIDNSQGILIELTNNNLIYNCTLDSDTYGIDLKNARSIDLQKNNFTDTGVFLEGDEPEWNSHTIGMSNEANGKPIKYVVGQAGGTISQNYGQVLMSGCQDVTLKNMDLSDTSVGIQIGFSMRIDIESCTTDSGTYGQHHFLSNQIDILNTSSSWNSNDGIFLDGTPECVLENVVCDRNNAGISIALGIETYIGNSTCNNNNIGIEIYQMAQMNDIYNTTLNQNRNQAIKISDSSFNTILDCKMNYNRALGVQIQQSNDNTIEDCVFIRNSNFAISLEQSSMGNQIYHCNFIRNNPTGAAQAQDDVTGNMWDKNSEGSYWSEWTAPDADTDGIVDNPYTLAGIISAVDNYPLVDPHRGPKITTVDNETAIEDIFYSNQYAATDPDTPANELNWDFSSNAGWWLSFSGSQLLSGMPRNSNVGQYWILIEVSDDRVYVQRNFTLTVENTNDRPYLNTTPVQTATEDVYYSQVWDAIDVDVPPDDLEWTMNTNASFLSMGKTSGELKGTPRNEDVGTYFVYVNVTDGNGAYDDTNFTIEVENTNDLPSIDSDHVELCYEDEEFIVQYNGSDIDPTNDVLEWTIQTDAGFLSMNKDSGILSGTPENDDVGEYEVNVTLSDGIGSIYDIFTLYVENTNDPPVITTTTLHDALEDDEFSAIFEATDMDPTEDTLTWTMTSSASFLEMDYFTGELSGTPENEDVGAHWVIINVSDQNDGYDEINLTFSVKNSNDGPEVNRTIGVYSLEEDTTDTGLNMNDIFKDVDGDKLKFQYLGNTNLTLSIDPDGVLEITPDDDWNGEDEVTFTAEDKKEMIQTTIKFKVTPVNDAPYDPRIELDSDSFNEGESINVKGYGEDVDLTYGDTLTYKWSIDSEGDIATGQSLDLNFYIDLEPGMHEIILNVSDKAGAWVEVSKQIEIKAVDIPPVDDDVVDDDDDDDDQPFVGSMMFFIMIGAIVIVILAVVAIVVLLVLKGKKKEPEASVNDISEDDYLNQMLGEFHVGGEDLTQQQYPQQPGVQQPGAQQPGVQQPGVQQPGVQQPGAQQPGVQPLPQEGETPSLEGAPPEAQQLEAGSPEQGPDMTDPSLEELPQTEMTDTETNPPEGGMEAADPDVEELSELEDGGDEELPELGSE